MPNNLDMGGFGSPGLPVMAALNGEATLYGATSGGNSLAGKVGELTNWYVTKAGAPFFKGTISTYHPNNGASSPPTTIGNGCQIYYQSYLAISVTGAQILFDSQFGFGFATARFHNDASSVLNMRLGTTAQTFRITRSYTDASNFSWLTHKWNTTTAVIHAEGAGTGSDGSIAFNDAALATGATVGFVMLPSCAGTPTGVPADIPTGQCPAVIDSSANRIWIYVGGAWKYAALT